MKKYVFVKTGEAVELGQKLARVANTLLGPVVVGEVEITEKTLPMFIKRGVISVQEEEANCTHVNIDYYIGHLAERINWKPENLAKYLNNLAGINEAAVFSILLREVAIVMDKKYPDHIERSKEIYVIGMTDGKIHKLRELHKVKNFRNFAAFRTIEDALCAKHILKDFMKELFKRGGK